MGRLMRRIRGAIGLGLVWGATWLAAGLVLLLIVGFGAADVPFPLFFGMLGFLAGVTFSLLLGLVERRRGFEEMSIPRFAAWGAAGGLLLALLISIPLGTAALPVIAIIFPVAAGVCAAGTLALARRGEDRTPIGAGDDIDAIGLTDQEKRELLGDGR